MEGMFLINIVPWNAHKSFSDYGDFQHIAAHFRNGSKEVHLLFDDPECEIQSPKFFERNRRDSTNPVSSDHCCIDITSDMIIPPKWRDNVLNCRKCKRSLVNFLSHYFLEKMKKKLRDRQKFVTAGGFNRAIKNKALYTECIGTTRCDSSLESNAEETDTRIWLHVLNSAGQNKLVLSPDTDVYHIGLPCIINSDLNVMVRLSPFSSPQLRILDMQTLIAALNNDPELAVIPETLRPLLLQKVYIATGCDFISFFKGFGKSTFLATLYEFCQFICSNSGQTPGILTDCDMHNHGFLSFVHLVGCAYYRKHKSAFLPSYSTPMMLFRALYQDNILCSDHHARWLDFVRDRIWSKIQYEEDMIPST